MMGHSQIAVQVSQTGLSNRKELRSLYNYADSLPGGATTNAAG